MISIWVKLLAVYTRERERGRGKEEEEQLLFLNACAVASNVFNSKSYNEFVKQQKAQQQQLATGNGGNNNKRTDLCFCFDSFSELRILSALPVELCAWECVCVCLFALLGRQSALAAQGLILFLVSFLCGQACQH